MNYEDIQNLVKDGLSFIKEKSLMRWVDNDANYQESLHRHGLAEQKYNQIKKSLSEEQYKIIEEYIEALDSINCDTNELIYMAGIADTITFLMSYGFIHFEYTEEK